MKFILVISVFCTTFISNIAFVNAQSFVSREQAFEYLWSTIYRPVYETRETQFVDVEDSSKYFDLLRFAKRRGILDDTEEFFPNNPVTFNDVNLWLLRTRNVKSIEYLTYNALPELTQEYPVLLQYEPSALVDSLQQLQEYTDQFDEFLNNQTHEISFYSEKFHGKGTAFGEAFDMYDYTAAHPSFPHNTLVRVTNIHNDNSVIVRINDRGPFVGGRSMDLSYASFLKITERASGIANVTIERLGDIELVPEKEEYLAQKNDNRVNISDSSSGAQVIKNGDSLNKNDTQENINDTTEQSVYLQQNSDEIDKNNLQPCSRFSKYYQKRLTKESMFNRGIPHVLKLGNTLTLQSTKFFVVRSIKDPFGITKIEQWIEPNEEKFAYTPYTEGEYKFTVQTPMGNTRMFTMQVQNCR